jgi:hypothetical protein
MSDVRHSTADHAATHGDADDMTTSTPGPPNVSALNTSPGPLPDLDGTRSDTGDLSLAGRVLLSSLLAAAGLIHLVMVPAHMAESMVDGMTFVMAGWLQLAFALVIAVRPTRGALGATLVVNAALVGGWAVSRVWGLPYGAHRGHPEEVAFVDLSAVGIEIAAVLAAGFLLWRPLTGRQWNPSVLVVASVVPVAALVLATAAIASPSAGEHGHGGHGDTAMGDGHAHTGAEGHAHGDDDGHAHGDAASMAAGDDLGLSLLENGHQHDHGEVALDARTQRLLDEQIALTRELARKYPTIADAEAAGYRRAGPFMPGLGTHYIGGQMKMVTNGVVEPDDIPGPVLIYDGVTTDAPISGFMYMAFGEDEPEGFAGGNDHWHWHTDVCVTAGADGVLDTPLGADRSATQAQCDQFGGRLLDKTPWMVHVWSVPGYENPRGIFAELNPALACPDGTYYIIPFETVGTRNNLCRSVN